MSPLRPGLVAEDLDNDSDFAPDEDHHRTPCLFSIPAKDPEDAPIYTDSPILSPVNGPGRKKRKRCRRLDISTKLRQDVPHEPNDCTEAKWQQTLALLLRYIDDGFMLSKINFENSFGMLVNGVQHRVKHALQVQNIFRHVVRNAERIGMIVNAAKTAMICILDALAYEADAYIMDSEGSRIGCQQSFKALGMHFSSKTDMSVQVNSITKKILSCYRMLRNLKKSGFTNDELVTVYKTMVRPVADYGAVVYHSSLNDYQDEALEGLQTGTLRCIYGPGISARKMRDLSGLKTLRSRREDMSLKFAKKCSSEPLFAHWFPLKTARSPQ